LFDSFFGYGLLRATCGSGYNAFYAKYLDAIVAQASVAGITVPSILLWCLGLGTLHLAFGLLLKAAQCFGRKQYLEGVFCGIVWALALVSLTLWVFGMVSGTEPLKTYGAYVTAGLFVVGVLTAGIAEKGLGKVVKVFSSAYGIINYASDILSYARLYGLMLSGAQIASIFTNTLAIGLLFPKGPVGIAFGVILIIVGNLFNLAMNLLGAFIHNSRLQYVEFFGKFYEGEGELFAPLGQTRRFVRLQR
jgi:V/A-type H+-transporting ATPase subunit I